MKKAELFWKIKKEILDNHVKFRGNKPISRQFDVSLTAAAHFRCCAAAWCQKASSQFETVFFQTQRAEVCPVEKAPLKTEPIGVVCC